MQFGGRDILHRLSVAAQMLAAASDLKDIGKRTLRLHLIWDLSRERDPAHSDERGDPAPGASRGRSF